MKLAIMILLKVNVNINDALPLHCHFSFFSFDYRILANMFLLSEWLLMIFKSLGSFFSDLQRRKMDETEKTQISYQTHTYK